MAIETTHLTMKIMFTQSERLLYFTGGRGGEIEIMAECASYTRSPAFIAC